MQQWRQADSGRPRSSCTQLLVLLLIFLLVYIVIAITSMQSSFDSRLAAAAADQQQVLRKLEERVVMLEHAAFARGKLPHASVGSEPHSPKFSETQHVDGAGVWHLPTGHVSDDQQHLADSRVLSMPPPPPSPLPMSPPASPLERGLPAAPPSSADSSHAPTESAGASSQLSGVSQEASLVLMLRLLALVRVRNTCLFTCMCLTCPAS